MKYKADFVILGMMRTGSNFLEQLIDSSDEAVCYGELLNNAFVGVGEHPIDGYDRDSLDKRDSNLDSFFEKVDQAASSKKWGFRLFLDHNELVRKQLESDSTVKKVILSRNFLDSYISLKKAQATDQWILKDDSQRKEVDKLIINTNDFAAYTVRHAMYYNEMYQRAARNPETYFNIDYSELNDEKRLVELFDFLGLSYQNNLNKVSLVKQNTRTRDDLIENYDEVLKFMRKNKFARWFI